MAQDTFVLRHGEHAATADSYILDLGPADQEQPDREGEQGPDRSGDREVGPVGAVHLAVVQRTLGPVGVEPQLKVGEPLLVDGQEGQEGGRDEPVDEVRDERGGGAADEDAEHEADHEQQGVAGDHVEHVDESWSHTVGTPWMADPTMLPRAPTGNATSMETTAMATAAMALPTRTRPRCGTRVNVVRPLRWLHSAVTDRIATTGSRTHIGKPMARVKVL